MTEQPPRAAKIGFFTWLWMFWVKLLSPKGAAIQGDGLSLTLIFEGREITLSEFSICGSVQRDFKYLDRPEFTEPIFGELIIGPGSPDAVNVGIGRFSFQNWYSVSTRRPSVLEARRIHLWLIGKLNEKDVV